MAIDKVYPVHVFLLLLMIAGSSRGDVIEDPSVIIEAVNKLRSSVEASDMAEMTWSVDLAFKANDYTSRCTTSFEFLPPGVGALMFMMQLPEFMKMDPKWAIDDWASQIGAYNAGNYTCYGTTCGGYAQLVWSSTSKMGCAYTKCPSLGGTNNKNSFIYICLFLPSGNFYGVPAYNKTGPVCSKCPSKVGWCTPTGLCSSSCVAQTEDCQCKQTCVNGGTVDKVACKCVCPPGFHGTDCSKKCVDNELCNPAPGQMGIVPRSCNTSFATNVCPKMCKICT